MVDTDRRSPVREQGTPDCPAEFQVDQMAGELLASALRGFPPGAGAAALCRGRHLDQTARWHLSHVLLPIAAEAGRTTRRSDPTSQAGTT